MKRLTALLLIILLPVPAGATGPLAPDNSGSTPDFSLRFARAETRSGVTCGGEIYFKRRF